jgi:ApaG protein
MDFFEKETRSIRVRVTPEPIEENSDPPNQVYAFAYTVEIENLGTETVQLLERHWQIYSAQERLAEVVGPGVVGEKPILEPGKSFTYTSSAIIKDPMGSMFGTYTFKGGGGNFFEVEIPRFELVYPIAFH